MDRLIVFLLILSIALTFGCCPHDEDTIKFSVRNQSLSTITFRSYNDGFSDATTTELGSSESTFTGGGGILEVDSVIFIRKSDNDTLIYRNDRHNDDIFIGNHFFNVENWINEGNNKYFYTVRDEDFEN